MTNSFNKKKLFTKNALTYYLIPLVAKQIGMNMEQFNKYFCPINAYSINSLNLFNNKYDAYIVTETPFGKDSIKIDDYFLNPFNFEGENYLDYLKILKGTYSLLSNQFKAFIAGNYKRFSWEKEIDSEYQIRITNPVIVGIEANEEDRNKLASKLGVDISLIKETLSIVLEHEQEIPWEEKQLTPVLELQN